MEALEPLKNYIILDLMHKRLTLGDLEWFSEVGVSESCREINGNLGRFIRNTYNLWRLDLGGKHPDDFSYEIMEELHKKLQ